MTRIEYYKKNTVSRSRLIGGVILAFLLIVSSILLLVYPFASTVKKGYFHGINPILFDGHQVGNALIEKNTLYVPLSFMQKKLDNTIVYDQKSNSIIITTSDKVIQMPTESLTYFVNKHAVKLKVTPFKSISGQMFVALDPLLSYYPIKYKKLEKSGAIWIQKDGERYRNGHITAKKVNKEMLRLRTQPTLESPYTMEIVNNEPVMIESIKDNFYLVRAKNGVSGYVKKDFVRSEEQVNIQIPRQSLPIKTAKLNGAVQLTWEAVYTHNPDSSKIPGLGGVNVVSPTWFSLAGNDGTIKNLASLEYTKWAKSKGYHVWGVFSNSFDPTLTHEVLKDFQTRQKMIAELLQYSQMYQIQGINFDIENVKSEDGPLVTQFMREATPYLHEAGLVVTMDVTFAAESSNWSSFYERKKLAQIADYLIVMAYDEHWGTSPIAGSVASFPWVEHNLQKLLTEVPSNRLILGVPLYSRLWKEQMNADGTKDVSSKALSMDKVKAWISSKGLKPTFDSESGQNYVEYYDAKENATYKIWIEDDVSLKKRAELSTNYHLAGIASWSRSFGDQTAWAALNLNQEQSITKK
ncbi:glycosyl hydrolase family 18 protein [Neobacillus sp. PS3-40]|uniref:glycosyl hydrolase family 18 protein n=1 Tax=Neobacillus sp. PS3-40 TaxID=3070679 RepID=UPI0027DF966B|nr:glycosyl hydrolase family 18 protein [Neobacillus sp. PS3-40]WML44493.1 glycosyl hydrolase family 18 protein [Neobacillus sp. PS3-40]